MRILICLFLLSISFLSYGQSLPNSRMVDWSLAGYNGTLPNYTTVVDIRDYGGVGDGIHSNDSAFSLALNGLSNSEGVIFFPAGIYLFNAPIELRSGIILRGASSDSTTLKFDLVAGNDLDAISISGGQTSTISFLVNDGLKDSSFLEVGDVSGFNPGDYLKLSFNDSDLLFSSWAYGLVGQIIQIKEISDGKLLLESPLRLNYLLNKNPRITKLDMISNVGIECLKIHRYDETVSQTSNISYNYAAQCWLSGVESYFCNFAHVEINSSTNLSILGSYFHNAHAFGGGGQGYGVLCQATSGECLIENNIFRQLRHSMILQSGANGNVFGYNYSFDPYWDEEILPSNSAGDLVLHGNYPYANLFEGNIGQNIVIDDSHGRNGPYNTFLRNRGELFGIFMNFNPASDSQNFIGNEVTNRDSGLYFLNGRGHFEYQNNIKGSVNGSGNTLAPVTSYYYAALPDFLNSLRNWPSIGVPNIIKSGTIPAKERYSISSLTTCSPVIPTGLHTLNLQSEYLIVYPNPSHGLVFLSSQNKIYPLEVFLYDYLGQLKETFILKNSKQALDVSFFPKGVYILKAQTKEKHFLPSKLLIQ